MTRVSAYSAALVVFVASSAMVLASIAMPDWLIFSTTTSSSSSAGVPSPLRQTIGLHRSCLTLPSSPRRTICTPYPPEQLCRPQQQHFLFSASASASASSYTYFCSMWRTTGWLASLSVVLAVAGLVSFAVTLAGGKYRRESGWPFMAGLISTFATVQLVVVSVVAYLFDNDDQFIFPGWRLGPSWYMALFAAVLAIVAAIGLALSAYLLSPEDGYEALD